MKYDVGLDCRVGKMFSLGRVLHFLITYWLVKG